MRSTSHASFTHYPTAQTKREAIRPKPAGKAAFWPEAAYQITTTYETAFQGSQGVRPRQPILPRANRAPYSSEDENTLALVTRSTSEACFQQPARVSYSNARRFHEACRPPKTTNPPFKTDIVHMERSTSEIAFRKHPEHAYALRKPFRPQRNPAPYSSADAANMAEPRSTHESAFPSFPRSAYDRRKPFRPPKNPPPYSSQ